jgi:carboxylate-amine ligase
MNSPLHLFHAAGIELEYMIVNKQSLKINPIADEVIKSLTGIYTSDTEYENIGWSNELVLHVIELKTPEPVTTLKYLDESFLKSIRKINDYLSEFNSVLLPTGAHPLMDPFKETKLWPHEYNAVYEAYNRIFGCKGHGWSNLQSVHLNLPFANDDEFGRLHAAIRILLPIIPALTASTPILDGRVTGYKDARLLEYAQNQKLVPSIGGVVIPERAFSKQDYENIILKKIYKDIAEFDKENILQNEWLNSRGAIARFDRNAFEIRIIDIQESPVADLAIAFVIIESLKNFVNEKLIKYEVQKQWTENSLAAIYNNVIRNGEDTIITDENYLTIFNLPPKSSAKNILEKLISEIDFTGYEEFKAIIDIIMSKGTLSTRIIKNLNNDYSEMNIISVYQMLANCLKENKLFTL